MVFSEKSMQILRDGGWTEDRLLPADSFIEKLTKAGYTPHPAALEVLQQFGGLEFSHEDLEGYRWRFHFDIDRTISICDIEDIEDYGNCIGTILCPVGEFDNGHFLVAVSEDGRVFSYFNPFICLDGVNYIEAIERYCMRPGTTIKRLVYDGNPLEF
jgi:hypothetical protein